MFLISFAFLRAKFSSTNYLLSITGYASTLMEDLYTVLRMSLLLPSNNIIGILNIPRALQIFIFKELKIYKCIHIHTCAHTHTHTQCSRLRILIESLHSLNNTMLDQTSKQVFKPLAY